MLELKFSSKIYKKKVIQKAISAYSNFAKFSLSQTNRYTKIRIHNISPSVKDIIVDEFSNYVLGLTKKCL